MIKFDIVCYVKICDIFEKFQEEGGHFFSYLRGPQTMFLLKIRFLCENGPLGVDINEDIADGLKIIFDINV